MHNMVQFKSLQIVCRVMQYRHRVQELLSLDVPTHSSHRGHRHRKTAQQRLSAHKKSIAIHGGSPATAAVFILMREPLSPSSQHQHLLQRIRDEKSQVLQYDARKHRLIPWLWSLLFMPLVKPDHRDKNMFVESAMLIAVEGPWSGEYVAMCAAGRCGYIAIATGSRSLKRTYTHYGGDCLATGTPGMPVPRRARVDELIHKFDSAERPGVAASLFYFMCVRCKCGDVMTRRVFRFHQCAEMEVGSSEDTEIADMDTEHMGTEHTDAEGEDAEGEDTEGEDTEGEDTESEDTESEDSIGTQFE
ncbi:hypothetical protein A0H81_14711 [Grifola frondosa]|uniref:Uncharacterized protein n=1 Tax=Grifola frondosa TaxID=5627 RepID=A0A1C7LKF7_GRIFR|nr:hypothetical protein A0H81_14711 [Grifola frondosa]